MSASITSANTTYTLAVPGVFSAPQTLHQFSADDIFDTDTVDAAEVMVGVDGGSAAGWVVRMYKQTIRFLASSPSCVLFDQWIAAQDAAQEVLFATGLVSYPSLGNKFIMNSGVLTRPSRLADAKRVLQPRAFEITWLPDPGVPAIIVAPI